MKEFDQLLHIDIQDYISKNYNTEITTLALQKNPFPKISFTLILNQLEAKKKAENKLPTWFKTPNIIYPEKLSIEQTSSEKTADYKATLVKGKSIIDLSGGFGIDTYYFSKHFENVIHCEINKELSEIVKHNNTVLNTTNITCKTGNSLSILEELNQTFDCIYVDPSRRNDAKGKVFLLQDCEPNIIKLQKTYHKYSDTILVKTAPILDLQSGILSLQFVKKIYIIALNNEVKEVLWLLEKDYTSSVTIETVNIAKTSTDSVSFILDKEENVTYDLQKKYLYEPNAAIMKSGKFNAVSEIYSIDKLHQHSHLYTSDKIIPFPGRSFEVVKKIEFNKNELKTYITGQKMNVSCRNFPIKPEEIIKKYKIKNGGNTFTFFTTNINNQKIALICKKITL